LLPLALAVVAACGTETGGRARSGDDDPTPADTGGGDTAADTGGGDTAVDTGGGDTAVDTNPDLTPCASDASCRGGEVCRSGLCREACGPNDPCEGELTACEPVERICVGCVSTGDCGPNEVCIDQACSFFCSSDAACAGGERCNAETGRCEAIGCTSDRECQGGFRCADGLCVPIGDPVCTPLAARCDGNTLLVCAADGSAEERLDCGDSAACRIEDSTGSCAPILCNPGEPFCSDDVTVSACDDTGTGIVSLPCGVGETCRDGACVASTCTPGARTCIGGDAYQCDASGEFAPLDNCTATETCEAGACVPIEGSCGSSADCLPPATSCDGNTRVSYRGNGSCVGGTCNYGAVERRTDCAATGQVCDAASAACADAGCGLTAASCTGLTPFFDAAACACLGCRSDFDCAADQGCNAENRCVVSPSTCRTSSDCPSSAPSCDGGFCVECMTSAACSGGDVCVRGVCEACDCPTGQVCGADGACVTVPTTCRSDAQCRTLASTLGFSGDVGTVYCSSSVGCFVQGVCDNPTGGIPLPTDDDPFDAECGGSLACSTILNFAPGGTFFNACGGCTVGDDTTCRVQETCVAGTLPGLVPNYCAPRSTGP
jgi:hypothetical protein